MLSLAAGGIVAASIATAWLPAVRDSGQRQEADEGRQLSVVARMSSTLLQSVLPAYSQSPTPEALSAALGGARMPMEQLLDEARSTAQIRELLLVTPTWDLVASSPAAQGRQYGAPLRPDLRRACRTSPPSDRVEPELEQERPDATLFEFEGLALFAACSPIYQDGRGAPIGTIIAVAEAEYLVPLAAARRRTTSLLLGLSSVAGLVVIFGVRWLLSPVREISDYAAKVASGARGMRVNPRGPEEIAQLARAVNALASSFEAREDDIQGRMAVVKQLSSMVAHEVRNPLQSLSLLSSLARTEPDRDTQEKLLFKIEDEIHVLEGVVQRFLRGSGPLQVSREPVDVVELVKRAAALADPTARARKVSLLVQAPGRLSATLDGSLIRRAMENLLLNAIEFSGRSSGGQVTVSVFPRGKQVMLIVDDDGPGVPPHLRERIFQPYYSSKPGGTGLGLALVKQVVDAHGGTLRCEDSPLRGARFTATLPLGGGETT